MERYSEYIFIVRGMGQVTFVEQISGGKPLHFGNQGAEKTRR